MGKKSRGSRGRRKSGKTSAVRDGNAPSGAEGKKAEGKKSPESEPAVAEVVGAKESAAGTPVKAEPTGFNRIPLWLRKEKGYSDLVAGALVTLAGGLAIIIIFYILILAWPAQ